MFLAIRAQALVVLVAAVVVWLIWGLSPAWVLYGGAVALAGSGVLVWRWYRGLHQFNADGHWHVKQFRRTFKARFFVVVLLLSAGFAAGLVGLVGDPLAMLSGFILGQAAWGIALAAGNSE